MTVTNTSPFYNVRDYGATGDGETDDTAAISEAITAAAPTSAPTGNTVYFPAGKYVVTSSLVVPPALALQGAGGTRPAPRSTPSPAAGFLSKRVQVSVPSRSRAAAAR